jgi:hypothetical protein
LKNENTIKYLIAPEMTYSDQSLTVPGNHRSGGDRILTVSLIDQNYVLQMM